VQDDHLHLIVEADDTQVLARGLRGLAIRVARAVNRALNRRGAVWGDRYHARALTSPRAVRNALVYVMPRSVAQCFAWLATVGWRKHGLIRLDEQPRIRAAARGGRS